jgi:uncharacterized membrane protein YfcA
MTATAVVTLLIAGLGTGFLAVLMVPLLYLYYETPSWAPVAVDPGIHAALAHATSLFVIVPTAIGGTLVYQRSGMVEWRAALPMAAGSVVAAVVGARVALLLPDPWLKLGFGLFLVASGVQLFLRRAAPSGSHARLAWPALVGSGVAAGFFSALLGVGGGLVAIPLLIYATRLPLQRVAATSLAVVVFAASAGVLGGGTSGLHAAELPPTSLGYVDLGAGLPILAGALLSVPLGARVNQRLPTRRLQRVFAWILLALGLQIVVTNVLAALG